MKFPLAEQADPLAAVHVSIVDSASSRIRVRGGFTAGREADGSIRVVLNPNLIVGGWILEPTRTLANGGIEFDSTSNFGVGSTSFAASVDALTSGPVAPPAVPDFAPPSPKAVGLLLRGGPFNEEWLAGTDLELELLEVGAHLEEGFWRLTAFRDGNSQPLLTIERRGHLGNMITVQATLLEPCTSEPIDIRIEYSVAWEELSAETVQLRVGAGSEVWWRVIRTCA